jgi:dTDP-4-amino-4,6-dideoxygalactose transaminase
MNIPFLDLKAQYKSIKDEVLPAINNVLDNTAYVLGKPVAEFEKAFAEMHNAKYCYCVGTGTAGNHMVLWGLGIKAGDEVIIPANTFIATAWGATLCGATPVFVDCHPENYNIDPVKIVSAITSKTKAIVVVHLYGQPVDLDGIINEMRKSRWELIEKGIFEHNINGQRIYLVEDCAQSHIAEYLPRVINDFDNLNGQHNIEENSISDSKQNSITQGKGQRVGSLGIASSFSFYPGKNLGAYGEGGAVMTDNEELARKFKMIRDHGAEQKYYHQIYGHNYRMEGIQGAVLGVKLKHLEDWTNGRRRAAAKYKELLQDVEGLKLPKEMDYAKHVYHLFVIQVIGKLQAENGKRSERRDELQKFLGDNGIATGLHYPVPLHQQPCFEHLGYKKGDFPMSEELAEQGLSLPMYAELTDEQIDYICDKIKEFFKD